MQTVLFIVSAPAYGSERMLSALRLATAIAAQEIETVDLRLFMMSDAVTVGLPNQPVASAGGGLQQMLMELVEHGACATVSTSVQSAVCTVQPFCSSSARKEAKSTPEAIVPDER